MSISRMEAHGMIKFRRIGNKHRLVGLLGLVLSAGMPTVRAFAE